MNIAQLLTAAAAERPDHPAFVFEDQVHSFAELDRLTNRFASALAQLEVGARGVIAIFLDSSPELVIAYLGALKAGVVPNLVNGMLKPAEVQAVVADSGALLLVTDAGRWDELSPVRDGLEVRHVLLARDFDATLAAAADRIELVPAAPDALASLLYTSGTTSRPKGVMLSHRNIIDNAVQFSRVHYQSGDRVLVAAPLFHCWGLINGVLGSFAMGATAIAVRRFQTEPVLNLIEQARPTHLLGVPTMIKYLSQSASFAGRDLSSLRTVLCAAAPMPRELIEVLRRDWRVGYAESYGLTETSPVITTTVPEAMRPGCCGKAMGDTELKVADADGRTLATGEIGELWARGTAISAGYFQQPEATAAVFTADGWFKTGDIVQIDNDGYVTIVDRAKDMIIVGGYNVYPRDIEEVLHRHPAVADAAVVGIPDANLGEVPKAYVALTPGASLSAEEVIDYLRPALASFKVPRVVELVEVVPRSPSGKALRRLLR